MPLTTDQTTQIFEILGVPFDGTGDIFSSLATLHGPAGDSYDMSGIVSTINARIGSLSSSQESRISVLLTRWDAIGSSSPLEIASSSSARGVLANHPAERAAIRETLGNIIGIAVPSGGFCAEARRTTNSGGTLER